MRIMENENQVGIQSLQLTAHKEILSFKESLLYLSVSPSFLYKLTSRRGINFTKPNGGKIYFRKSDLDTWMLQNEVKSLAILEEEINEHLNKN